MEHCLEGFNVAVLAYGQTGAGKTHSMIGVLPPVTAAGRSSADDPASQAGLAPRVFDALFEGLEEQRSAGDRPVSASSRSGFGLGQVWDEAHVLAYEQSQMQSQGQSQRIQQIESCLTRQNQCF